MKFNHNHKKPLNIIAFFSFCAIATAVIETAAIKPSSRNESFNQAIEQQLQEPNQPKALIPGDRPRDENWEEINPEQELDAIFKNESGEEILLASCPNCSF